MGLKLEEIRNRTLQKNNTDIKSQDTKNCPEQILQKFHEAIERLPSKIKLKRLLKKCIVGLFLGEKIESEISFLNDVRKMLDKIRDNHSNEYYLELLEILEEIYFIAIDRQFENSLSLDPENQKTEQILKALQDCEPYSSYFHYYEYYDEMGNFYYPDHQLYSNQQQQIDGEPEDDDEEDQYYNNYYYDNQNTVEETQSYLDIDNRYLQTVNQNIQTTSQTNIIDIDISEYSNFDQNNTENDNNNTNNNIFDNNNNSNDHQSYYDQLSYSNIQSRQHLSFQQQNWNIEGDGYEEEEERIPDIFQPRWVHNDEDDYEYDEEEDDDEEEENINISVQDQYQYQEAEEQQYFEQSQYNFYPNQSYQQQYQQQQLQIQRGQMYLGEDSSNQMESQQESQVLQTIPEETSENECEEDIPVVDQNDKFDNSVYQGINLLFQENQE